jgi:hypothetical protein
MRQIDGITNVNKKFTQTCMKPFNTTNLSYSDAIMGNKDDSELVLFHNINRMKDTTNWYQILTTMKEFNVDIFGFAELNRSLNRGYKNEWTDITRKLFYYSRSVHSKSNVQLESSYKPGGTMTTITGKWQSRITQQGQDNKGLG